MVENGHALAVMGNHEFNAVVDTEDPEQPGQYLRPHFAKNLKQHKEFLEQVGEGSEKHRRMIDWFKPCPSTWICKACGWSMPAGIRSI